MPTLTWNKWPDVMPPAPIDNGIDYLTCNDDGFYRVANIWVWETGPLWVETQEYMQINVTHWAEIPAPEGVPS